MLWEHTPSFILASQVADTRPWGRRPLRGSGSVAPLPHPSWLGRITYMVHNVK
jgi:hypothetical protein